MTSAQLVSDVLVILLREGDGPHHEAKTCLSKAHTRIHTLHAPKMAVIDQTHP